MCAMHAYDYAAFGRLIVPTALQGFNQLNADSVRDVRNACVRLRRLWAANRTYGAGYGAFMVQLFTSNPVLAAAAGRVISHCHAPSVLRSI